MQCRKCGAKHITRRRAGVFACQHCGVQPGPTLMDRFGNARLVIVEPEVTATDYVIAPRQPRMKAGIQS